MAIARYLDSVQDLKGAPFAAGADRGAVRHWIESGLRDPGAQWSAGTYGAIAEFSRDIGEDAKIACTPFGGEASTARGGIRVELGEGVRAVAYETTTKNRDQWSHAIAFCLPKPDCAMGRWTTIHEVGPDQAAIRPEDRASILFDLGLGAPQVDVCVRTSAPEVMSALRAGEGRSIFETGNPAVAALFGASPHRVFLTRMGRAEVYQAIPPSDGKSPDGPHTHLLPKLLRSGRTHPATVPIPHGWVPCFHLYPVHPQRDGLGMPKSFDRVAHNAFRKALASFGDQELLELKGRVFDGVRSGKSPEALAMPQNRFARGVIRVALRQLHALDGPSPDLSKWRMKFDLAETAGPSDPHC